MDKRHDAPTGSIAAVAGGYRVNGRWSFASGCEHADWLFGSGGGSSIYADCPLQRRLRDIQAMTQHFLVRRDTLTTAGAILAGHDVQVMVF